MIKQDYLLRMIQEIITLLISALLNRQKIRKESWVEYDDITRQILGVPSDSLMPMRRNASGTTAFPAAVL